MSPGKMKVFFKSITLVDLPIHFFVSALFPSQTIFSPRIAIASAVGTEGSMVMIVPLVKTRSAGCCSADTTQQNKIQKNGRMFFIYLLLLTWRPWRLGGSYFTSFCTNTNRNF